MPTSHRLPHLLLVILILLAAALPTPAARAEIDAGAVRISQVFGSGGLTGAPLRSDFVELYNTSPTAIDLNGWSIQYAAADANNWNAAPLGAVTIAPHAYLLVKLAEGSSSSDADTPLALPDVVGGINLSSRSGKVALAQTTAPILGPDDAAVRDLVGYGNANAFEGGAAAPILSNTTAILRKLGGCTDTDHNAADFEAAAPEPRNSASFANICGLRIRDVQSDRHVSPYTGALVRELPGIITVIRPTGFYLQDPAPDNRVATSEGVFVATTATAGLSPGHSVLVSGLVQENRPGHIDEYLSVTQVVAPEITVVDAGNALPNPIVVGSGGRIPPNQVIDNDANGDVETGGNFQATVDGIDFWESLEGMLVQVNDAVVVGPTNSGRIMVVGDNGALANQLSPRGALVIDANDFNPERIAINPLFQNLPRLNVSDRFSQPLMGPLDYSDGLFEIQTIALPAATAMSLPAEAASATGANQISIATLNVHNLGPDDQPFYFEALGLTIAQRLAAPDLLVLEEVQDNSGAANNGVVDAGVTLALLIDAIEAAGGPAYQYRQINPRNLNDGGQLGGNIRVVFLFRSDRGLQFIDRPGGDATTPTQVINTASGPQFSLSPGRIDPQNPVFHNSRKPLVGEFLFRGQKLFVIGCHFNSRIGDTPPLGRYQPPALYSEPSRIAMAQTVHNFGAQILAFDPAARVLVLGDFNEFHFAPALQTLAGTELHNLTYQLPANERYSYIYQGNAQQIDHVFASSQIFNQAAPQIDIVHLNPEYAEQVQFTDHDPVLVRFDLPAPNFRTFIPIILNAP